MKRNNFSHLASALCLTLFLSIAAVVPARAQGISSIDRERALVMLDEIKGLVKKNYYDSNFHGIDVEARFASAEEMIKKATALGQAFGIIAETLMGLDDSHTFFLPPEQTASVEYGWEMQAIGNICYVSAVKPGTDAEAKGLKQGDAILAINGVIPRREDLWKINYLYKVLWPQAGMRLMIQSPDGQRRQVDVQAKIRNEKRTLDLTGQDGGADIGNLIREYERDEQSRKHRFHEVAGELLVWKMPAFDLSADQVDDVFKKATRYKSLIMDLRGNPGGAESTLLRVIGNLFDHDISLGNLQRRKETKPLVAKSRGKDVFTGKLVILVDSESGSCSELLARIVQLEKRGTVMGDQSAGAVMRSRHYRNQMGRDIAVFYGASVTDADILMSDGRSLERIGVTPDELLLPSAKDLAEQRDPVLAHSAEIAGVKLDPAKAAALFPRVWSKQ